MGFPRFGFKLLLLVLVATNLWTQGVATRNAAPASRSALSGRPFPVSFVDVAHEAGLQMRFTSGSEASKKYIVEANGSGVALVDYDNDGWLDAFLVNGSRLEGFPSGQAPTSLLYRNNRDGTFADVTKKAGLARAGWGNGVCAGDIDNDWFEDFYVTYWGVNALYRNKGDGTFTDVAERGGTAGDPKSWSSGCTFLDYDRDGYLDLFVSHYAGFDPANTPLPGRGPNCEWKGLPVFCGPRGLPHGSATLYRNRGDGTFENVTKQAGIAAVDGYYAFTALAADLNGDAWTDIYVACDGTPSIFFRNNQDGTFTDIGAETGVAFNEHGFEQAGMGVGVGDFDNDRRPDLVKTNFAGDYPNLYRNLGGGIFEDVVLKAGLGVNPQYVGWGVALVDLDNDGWKDIFQVNGHVYPEIDRLKGPEQYRNPRLVYRNLGTGRFEDVSALAGPGVAQKMSSRGAAFGDFDNDGDIDVLIMNMGEPPSLLRNDLKSGNHWIRLKLHGTKSNRTAVGAIATIDAGGRRQTDAVVSQSSFLSQSDFRLHFGLGKAAKVERIEVRWPGGAVEDFPGSVADREVVLVEGQGKR
ncbi:MAG: CRTAC1 family protein [Bryobacteraceae bacterium]